MLSGYGVDANYEKLRELCQTEVDGTSVDALEDLCLQLGLDVCQHIVPRDLVAELMRARTPVIAVQEPTAGRLHFVVAWSQLRSLIQVMDPQGGRKWVSTSSFVSLLVRHTQRFSKEEWIAWFPSSSFSEALSASARSLLSADLVARQLEPVLQKADPAEIAALDCALRLTRRASSVSGSRSRAWFDRLFSQTYAEALRGPEGLLPEGLWCIDVNEDEVAMRCAVLLGVVSAGQSTSSVRIDPKTLDLGTREKRSLFASVFEVLGRQVWPFAFWIAIAMLAVSVASAVELLVYRTALDLPALVNAPGARLGAASALLSLLAILLGLETSVAYGVNRLGRLLEMKLRMRTLWALPRVDDGFIKSRPTSDLAYRAQALSMGALLIPSLAKAAGAVADLAVTLLAIAILDYRYAVTVVIGAGFFVVAWATARGRLQEVDTRLQVHASRLLSILLDTLRGSRPLRLHGYQDAFRDDQQRELELWRVSAFTQLETTALLQARYTVLGALMLGVIFLTFHVRHGDPRQFVVLAFWSFRIPPIITRLIQFAQTYPLQRNAVDRLLEVTRYVPVVAPPETVISDHPQGAAIELTDVSVVLGGHSVLEGVNLDIPAGQHVAIVGASGSGKSTIVGLLLGIHEPAAGELRVDGQVLDRGGWQSLRDRTMWIDPAVQLWNDSIGANLEYACRDYSRRPALEVLESSDLLGVLASVERGLDAPVGAEGGFVSGGEGQRIRIGRALFRAGTRLALLDEPFRGLDRATRHKVLLEIRGLAIRSTMIFVSHDISHALGFERVLVIDGGRIIEDGSPQELSSQDSAFARLLAAEKEVLESAWGAQRWRRVRVEGGLVREGNNSV
jgi:ATP-binding cassette subfamily B protein